MDANQDTSRNPFDMDEACTRCDALCAARTRVVHGYGDVGADFLFVGGMPDADADATGIPFAGGGLFAVLERLGLLLPADEAPADAPDAPDGGPVLDNAYLTTVTRCRHPDRGPTEAEVANCEPYLNADVRMINPEILVPVGGLALAELAREHTTTPAADLDVAEAHATTVRGRGFELVPMLPPADQTPAQTDAFVEHFRSLMGSDYRQTKGRRGR